MVALVMRGIDDVTGLEPVGTEEAGVSVGVSVDTTGVEVGTTEVGVWDPIGVDDEIPGVGVSVTDSTGGVYVGLPGPQIKPILPMPRSQSSCSLSPPISNPTEVAPPHWSLVTSVPAEEHLETFLQVDPSGMPKETCTSTSTEVKRWNLSMENPVLSSPQEMEGEEVFSMPLPIFPVMHFS